MRSGRKTMKIATKPFAELLRISPMAPSVPSRPAFSADKALDGAPSGARDVVATFGFALAFWQPGLTCSLDNPLILLAEGRIVGKAESFLQQSLHCVPWSQLEELRNRRCGLCVLPAPSVRGGEINVGEPERLPGRNRLEAPVDGLSVPRQVRYRYSVLLSVILYTPGR